MKKIILILMVLSLIMLSSCAEKKPLCSYPYIEYKVGECCLDNNENGICDNDEPANKLLDAVGEGVKSNSVIKIIGDIADTNLVTEEDISDLGEVAGSIAEGIISSIKDVTNSDVELVKTGSPEAKELENVCKLSDISMKFLEFNDVKQICFDRNTNTINFTIQNAGAKQVDGIIVQAVSKTAIEAKEIKKTLPMGGIIKDYVPYDMSQNGEIIYARFNPEVTTSGGKVLCGDNALIKEGIEVC